ncbi:MAG TPA: hypothetical protein VF118_00695 [Gemmatimonadaceae bacterium]
MTSTEVTVRFSAHSRNLLIGKVAASVLIGVGLGFLYHWSSLQDYNRGVHLTLSDYTAGFDAYRLDLMTHYWPIWGDLLFVVILVAIFLAVYEGLSYFFAWLLGVMSHPRGEPAGAPDLIG